MIKLYFKKLLSAVLFIIRFIVLILLERFGLYLLFTGWVEKDICTIIIIVSAICLLIRSVYFKRLSNLETRRVFKREMKTSTFSFASDFKRTVTSTDCLMQTLAVMTIVFLFDTPIAISTEPPWYVFIIGNVLLLAVTGVLFSTLDALLWYAVHRRWMSI